MTDKEKLEKVRAEIERRVKYNTLSYQKDKRPQFTKLGKIMEDEALLNFIDSLQEEPKECMYSKDNYTGEDRKALCDGCEEECKFNKKEEPVSEEIEVSYDAKINEAHRLGREEGIFLAKTMFKEPVSEDLENAIGEYCSNPDNFATWIGGDETDDIRLIIKAIKFGARWQLNKIRKAAIDGDINYWNQRGLSMKFDKSLEKLGFEEGTRVKVLIIKE